jgi:hypothetical protein
LPAGSIHSLRTSWMKLPKENVASSPPGMIVETRSKEPFAAINEVDVKDSDMSIGAKVICSITESVEATAYDRAGPALVRPPKRP